MTSAITKKTGIPKRGQTIFCFSCEKTMFLKAGVTAPAGWRRLNLFFHRSAISGKYSCGDCVPVNTPRDFLEFIGKAVRDQKECRLKCPQKQNETTSD